MKHLLSELRVALTAALALAAVCCGLYPLVVFGIAQLAFRDRANGSLIVGPHGVVRGSQLLGQAFFGEKYFQPRPSAAGNGYDAASSGGSNLGPTSRKLRDSIKERIDDYRKENGLAETVLIPADAVTASGSGLDPHISPESARLQIARVAAARGLAPAAVGELVERSVEGPQLGFLGEPRVNILRLNRALDRMVSAR
jgi:potassium-transporting ATPase KdpC subunit